MSVANADKANDASTALREEREGDIQELTEAEQKRKRIEQSIREKTTTIYIDGEHRIKSTRVTGDEEEWFRDLNRKEEAGELSREEDEEAEQKMIDILYDHAQPEWITRSFVSGLPTGVKMEWFRDLVTGGEEAEEMGNSSRTRR